MRSFPIGSRRSASLLVSAASFLFVSCRSRAFSEGPLSKAKMVNAEVDRSGKFASTVGIGESKITCSGTKIGEHLILTAAHCVDNTEFQGVHPNYLPGGVVMVMARAEATYGDPTLGFTVRKIHLPPDWSRLRAACDPEKVLENDCWIHSVKGLVDLAVLEVEESLSDIPTSKIFSGGLQPGQAVMRAGYGWHVTDLEADALKFPLDGNDLSRRIGAGSIGAPETIETFKDVTKMYVADVAKELPLRYHVVLDALAPDGKPILSWSGDSGGPLFVEENGVFAVAGAYSGNLITGDQTEAGQQLYPPYSLFTKLDGATGAWLSSVVSESAKATYSARNALPAKNLFKCTDVGGQDLNFLSFLIRTSDGATRLGAVDASVTYVTSSLSFSKVTSLVEDGTSKLSLLGEGGRLKGAAADMEVTGFRFNRLSELTSDKVVGSGEIEIDAIDKGVKKSLKGTCRVFGATGSHQEFFNHR